MNDKLENILDECIDRINRGEAIETCLADYPEHRQELGPLLHALLETKTAYSFKPSAQAKNFHRQRFNAALVASREKGNTIKNPLFNWILGRSKVWAPIAAAIVVALVGYFGLRPALTPPVMIAQPNPQGNFAFLMSDEVNDIGDFEELNISISRVSLHPTGANEEVIAFEPEMQMVNLTQLQGNRAQEIWRGDIPKGEYSKVFLEVSEVRGILLESGEEIEIKLPSGKLQISTPFEVRIGEVTNFVYDLTVVKAGKSGQYILKPQVGQSGADQDFIKVEPEEQTDSDGKSKGTGKGKKSSGNQ
ncbi:DUF4382 domain-containing protein [Chloroflexota bacterium]